MDELSNFYSICKSHFKFEKWWKACFFFTTISLLTFYKYNRLWPKASQFSHAFDPSMVIVWKKVSSTKQRILPHTHKKEKKQQQQQNKRKRGNYRMWFCTYYGEKYFALQLQYILMVYILESNFSYVRICVTHESSFPLQLKRYYTHCTGNTLLVGQW